MKKVYAILLLLCMVSFISLTAQNFPQTETLNGLRILLFEAEAGKIKVFQPEHLFPGTRISGAIRLEPAGRNGRQQNKNREELESYLFIFAGQSTDLLQVHPSWQVPETGAPVSIQLQNPKGAVLTSLTISVRQDSPPAPATLQAPAYLRAGQAEKLTGPFDGLSGNTTAAIGNRPAEVLAEGPGEIFVETPSEISGPTRIHIREESSIMEAPLNVVDLQLTAGSTQLTRGQSTTIRLTLTGLQGLEAPISASLTNQSPERIALSGGDAQTFTVPPEEVGPDGTFTREATATARRPGGFSVQADIAPPPAPELAGLQPCSFNDIVYLLDCSTCESLGGRCREEINSPEAGYPVDELPLPPLSLVWENPPSSTVESDQTIRTGIRATDEVLAVRYSYRLLGSGWQVIPPMSGSMHTELVWPTSGLSPGTYELQVDIAAEEDRHALSSVYFTIPGGVAFSMDEEAISEMSDEELRDSLAAVRDRIRRLEGSAPREERAAENEAERQRIIERQLEEAIRRQEEKDSILQAHRAIYDHLREIDNRLERVEDTYGARIDSLANALRRAAEPPDLDALRAALADAEADLRQCEERRQELQNQIDEIEAQIDARHEEVLAVAKEVTGIMTKHGWSAGYHEWPDGRVGFGGVGDESHTLRRDHPDYDTFHDRFNEGRKLNREIRKLNRQLAGLEATREALDDCRRQQEAVEAARQALEAGETAQMQRNELDEICEEIHMLLQALQDFCDKQPGICHNALLVYLESLLEDCPSPEEWEAFFRQFDRAVNIKAGIEEGYGRRVATDSTRAAQEAEIIDRLREELEQAAAAEASRRARAAAQREQLERDRAARAPLEAEEERRREIRNLPRPVTPYPEPVPISDTELKGIAHAAILGLADKVARVDAIVEHGTDCTCELKALRAADIALVEQVLAGFGIDVMFAPLSALPVGKGAKLGIALLKDFAKSMFGGDLTQDVAKTLLQFAGGEVFCRLLDSEYFGEKASKLSLEAANRLMREMADDLVGINWDGDVQVLCRYPDEKWISLHVEVNGYYNKATGWAVLRIETDDPDCPGILVKYRVNEEGVLISSSVQTKELP